MAKSGRFGWQGLTAVGVLIALGRVSASGETPEALGTPAMASNARVRAEDPDLAMLIRQASDQSATFRSLVDAIQATNGVVYVIRGRCGHHLRACLVMWMAVAGPNRMLRVMVDDERRAHIEKMASLGHELRHALEVLTESNVTTGAGMFNFYRHSGAVKGVFETEAGN